MSILSSDTEVPTEWADSDPCIIQNSEVTNTPYYSWMALKSDFSNSAKMFLNMLLGQLKLFGGFGLHLYGGTYFA